MNATTYQMRNRINAGRDPITGRTFQTCGDHSTTYRNGRVECNGCGREVTLTAHGDWAHKEAK